MKTNITYRADIPIGAIGPSVWAKLGPEEWFDNYKLVIANARGYVPSFVRDLGLQNDDLEAFTTQAIVETPECLDVLNGELKEYRFLVYKPLEPLPGVPVERLIANDISFARYEDKKVFRDTFQTTLPIPEFEIIDMSAFLHGDLSGILTKYQERFGTRFVVQDNRSGGGRGTFIIDSLEDLQRAHRVMQAEHKGEHVIVSRFVSGIERSTQVFVSADTILRGPLQQQLVRNEELLDPKGRGGMYFCGGKFLQQWSDTVEEQVQAAVTTAAQELQAAGYRGIFGLDFIVTPEEKVYTIELNARTTGLLPLLNEQRVETPLYLLHILELLKEPYQLQPESLPNWRAGTQGPASFVVLFNTTGLPAWFNDQVTTGNYTFREGRLEKIDDEPRWNDAADVMVQLFADAEFHAKPNLKLANIFLKDGGFDENGTLSPTAHSVIKFVKEQIKTEP